jgi:6-pyruvoyltetrahydropterin/6-carboxytetrahydropterin synthase
MIELRRTWRFCASHRLFRPDWSDARNLATYGPAANVGGHGHNYRLTLVLEAEVDPETGRAVDVEALDRAIEQGVIQRLDHRNMNVDLEGLLGKVPTAENLVLEIRRLAERCLPQGVLVEVVLQQDEFLSVSSRVRSTPKT